MSLPTVPPLLLAVLMTLCAAWLSSCSREEEETQGERVEREARELGDALAAYSAERKDEAVEKAREALGDLDRRINQMETRLEERWSEMDQAAREEARQQLETLKEQRGEVATWYQRLEESSAEAWTRVRKGFTDAYAAFRETWRESEAELDSEP